MIIPTLGPGQLPQRASDGAAGADLYAAAEVRILPGERQAVPTGIRLAIPPGWVGLIWPRSGLALRSGLDTLAGVIDSDYRGEVLVLLINLGQEPATVQPGDRVAQLLVQPVAPTQFVRVTELPATHRGEGGFGSTGG